MGGPSPTRRDRLEGTLRQWSLRSERVTGLIVQSPLVGGVSDSWKLSISFCTSSSGKLAVSVFLGNSMM